VICGRSLLAVLAAAVVAAPLAAAPPAVGTTFRSVTVDGVRLGEDFTPTNFNDFPTVLFDPASGLFHLWVHDDTGFELGSIVHATSFDGIDFNSTGNLTFSGGLPNFADFGASEEPIFQFLRAVRAGDNWKLLMWTPLTGVLGDYDYNVTIFDLGTNPNNLNAIHQGPVQPVPGGTSGQTNGPYGLISSSLFAGHDAIGGLARYTLTDGSPPSVGPAANAKDLVTGTGFVNFTIAPADPNAAYVSNAARTLDQGDGTLGTFYALRLFADDSRAGKQIFYVESADGGTTWSAPVGLFADGDLVTVDGALNTGNFSHPEVTLANGQRILYFATVAGDGKFGFVTNAPPPLRVPEIPTLSGAGGTVLVMLLLAAGALVLTRARR
jgi:hypothetical protein